MSDLNYYFAQNGLEPYLGYTQTAIILLDERGGLLEWNPAFDKIKSALTSAAKVQDFLTESACELFDKLLQAEEPRQARLAVIPELGTGEFNCLVVPLPDGKILLCAEKGNPAKDLELAWLEDQLEQARHTILIKEVELESVLAQADEISSTDALTFLSNRKRIIVDLQREIISCNRYPKPLTIFMVDIDHFKVVNDTYGHAAGDQVLRELSGRLLASIRQTDLLGRYGGEEFLFVLPGTAQEHALILANRLLQTARSLPIDLAGGRSIHLTISLGIAQYQIGKENWEQLLKRADLALYEAKHAGRNRWVISNPILSLD